ncbi:uncharacterized protein EHS24_003338 [Apiotrichum porosum]|uniref:Uncharacterized protein n=1 Tax=Apiotrichum porosum TaxID=105984 RepID=A0A427XEV3_9TREE|nr:uncharacterized protein EHS24_003338 [Apiotrichum porosum]RSH77378.1 hypothetical protein EHS24_003338 [Apiotrichum porosum]
MAEVLTYDGRAVGMAFYYPGGGTMPCPVSGTACYRNTPDGRCAYCRLQSFEMHKVPPQHQHLQHLLHRPSTSGPVASRQPPLAPKAPKPPKAAKGPAPPISPFYPPGASLQKDRPKNPVQTGVLKRRGPFGKKVVVLPQAAAPPNDPLDCDGIRAWRAESAMMAQTRDKRRLDEQMWYINHLPPHLREQMLQALRTENQPPPMGIVLPPSREGVETFARASAIE